MEVAKLPVGALVEVTTDEQCWRLHDPTELLQCLPRIREIFPQSIQMEWSIAEYLTGMKETEEPERQRQEFCSET